MTYHLNNGGKPGPILNIDAMLMEYTKAKQQGRPPAVCNDLGDPLTKSEVHRVLTTAIIQSRGITPDELVAYRAGRH